MSSTQSKSPQLQRPLTSLSRRTLQNQNTQKNASPQPLQRPQTTGGQPADSQDYNSRYNASSNFKKIDFDNGNNQMQRDLGFASAQQSQVARDKMPFIKQSQSEVHLMDVGKIMPKNIHQDQERLYEELIHSKQFINTLKQDNHKLQTQAWTMRQQILKYEAHLEEEEHTKTQSLVSSLNMRTSKVSSALSSKSDMSSIVPNLKKQVVELSQQLTQKDKEMTTIKRNVKLTKISELEVELKTYMDETVRLKRLLQQSLQLGTNQENERGEEEEGSAEERFLMQLNQISNLKSENQKLLDAQEQLKQQLEEKDRQIKEMERLQQKSAKDKSVYKKLLNEKERQLDKFQGVEQAQGKKNYGPTEGQFKIQLEKKINECNELNMRVQEKEKKIIDLESKSKDLVADFQEKLSIETREKESWKLKNEKEHLELVELKEKYDQLFPIKRNKDRRAETAKEKGFGTEMPSNFGTETPSNKTENLSGGQMQNQLSLQRKRTNGEAYILQTIGAELRARLRSKKICFSDIDQQMFSSAFYTKQVTTQDELKLILKREPFNLTNEDELNVICHHLTESDIQEESVFSNEEEKTYKVDKVKSLFKKTIGYYTIYSPETHIEQFQEIKKYLAEKEKAIKSYFTHDNLQHVERKKFESFMKLNDAAIDPSLLDFLYQVNYESTKSPNYLNFEYVFNQFSLQVPQQQPSSNAYFNNNEEDNNAANYLHQSTVSQKTAEVHHPNGNSSEYHMNQENQTHNNNNHVQFDQKLTDLKKLQSQEPDSYSNTPKENYNNSNSHNHVSSKNINSVDLNIPVTLSMNYQQSQQNEETDRQSGSNSRIQMAKNEEEHKQSPNGQIDRAQQSNVKTDKHSSQFKGQHDKEKEIKAESKEQDVQEDFEEEEVEF